MLTVNGVDEYDFTSELILNGDVSSTTALILNGDASPIINGIKDVFNNFYGIDSTDIVAVFDQTRIGAGDVSIWNDLSGNTNHIEQETAGNQPSIPNGYRQFDGAADFMHQEAIASGNITQANCLKSLIDGNAFVDIGVDLSAYAGADSGDHIYELIIKDSAGKAIKGYIGASGGGETLGSELAPDNCCTSLQTEADNTNGYVVGGGGELGASSGAFAQSGSYSLKLNNNASPSLRFSASVFSQKMAIKYDYYYYVDTGDPAWHIDNRIGEGGTAFRTTPIVKGTWTNVVNKGTADNANPAQGWLRWENAGLSVANGIYFDSVSIKQITDCSTDGVHILSTKDGSTQNWNFEDAAFDYNDAGNYTYEIRKAAFSVTGDLSIIMKVKPDDGQPVAAQTISAKMDETNNFMAFGITLDTAGKIVVTASNDGAVNDNFITNAAVFANGAQADYTLIGFVYTASTGNIDIYVAGSEVASTEQNAVGTSIYDSNVPFALGRAEDGSYFDGAIQKALIFDRALTSAEMTANAAKM